MSNFVKRTILVLLVLSFIMSVAVFSFTHRGAFNAHAAPAVTQPNAATLSVYFGSDNDLFYALDAPHGTLRWSYQYPPGGNTWSPTVVINGGVIYFEVANSSSTAVVSLRRDGSKRWIFTFPAQTYGTMAVAVSVANNIAYFAVDSTTGTSNLYALNTKDGSVAWTYGAAANDVFGNPVLDVNNNVLYVAEHSLLSGNRAQLDVINATNGLGLPSHKLPATPSTNLTLANGVIYFGGPPASLYAFDPNAGKVLWSSQVDGGPVSTPTVATVNGISLVYYASASNFVTAVNTTNGSLKWDYQVGKPFAATVSPVVDSLSGKVYIGSMNSVMYALKAATGSTTGTLVWKTKIGTPITTTAAIKNGIIHVGLQNGTLRTLNTSDGVQRWFYHTVGKIYTSSPPVVA